METKLYTEDNYLDFCSKSADISEKLRNIAARIHQHNAGTITLGGISDANIRDEWDELKKEEKRICMEYGWEFYPEACPEITRPY